MTTTAAPATGERTAGKNDPGAAPRRRRSGRLRRIGLPYLLLLPALLLELLVHLVPMIIGIVVSFRELTQFYIRDWATSPWAGFDNYAVSVDFDAPVGEALLRSFLITCLFTVLSVGLCWLLGTAAAVFMQETFRGRGFLRTLFLVPYALPVYAAVITWAFMFQRDNGIINHVIHDQLGLTDSPPFWLLGDNSFVTLLVVSVWKGWPFAFLIMMAGLQNIPRDIYEAAALDGAGSGSRSAASPCRPFGRSTRSSSSCCSCGRSTTSTRRSSSSGSRPPLPRTSSPSTSTSRPSRPGTSARAPRCPSCFCCSCSW